ncbi:hypothetical protein R1sor_010371 [Riccia sorocarpa]|uniref:Uncharacterized protein n=1 Tax=Riccia sorocarpa TaxID=122646 RepID=A0ABD3I1E2_9MARC
MEQPVFSFSGSFKRVFQKFEEQTILISNLSQELVSVRAELDTVKKDLGEVAKVKSVVKILQDKLRTVLGRMESQNAEGLKRIHDKLGEQEQALQKLTSVNEVVPTALDIQSILSGLETHFKTYAEVARECQVTMMGEQEAVRRHDLESKLQSFDEVTREAQVSALMNQEREQLAQQERSLNIRVVGMEEKDGENIEGTGAPIYQSSISDDLFMEISRIVLKLEKRGPQWILGDFNSRTGTFQPGDDMDSIPCWGRMTDSEWTRESEDEGRKAMADGFLSFLASCNLTILNGSKNFSGQ